MPFTITSKRFCRVSVRLKGCLDEMHNILGESVPESVMAAAIIKSGFDSNAAADAVLGQQGQDLYLRHNSHR